MKTLILYNLSIATIPIAIFHRILNFKIFFISVEKYFRNKRFLSFLSFFSIKWLNYEEYKINDVINERYLKALPFSEKVSENILKNYWCKSLEEIFENKYYFQACLSKKIFGELFSLIEIMTIAEYFKEINHQVYLWAPNTFISRKINEEFYKFKNLNIFPNFAIFNNFLFIVIFYIKKIKNYLLILFYQKTKQNIEKKIDNKYSKFQIAYFPHKTIFYSNLYIKDYFYSPHEKNPFFCENILHVEWEKSDITKKAKNYYEQNKIKYFTWKDFGNDFKTFKKMIFYVFRNKKFLYNLIKTDVQITYFLLVSIFHILRSVDRLSILLDLKIVLVSQDYLFPAEISIACKKRKITTIALQDRIVTSTTHPSMIFDYYFAAGQTSKDYLKKKMPSPMIENLESLYLVKIDKYNNGKKVNDLTHNISKSKLKCLVIDYHSLIPWYENGRNPLVNWRFNKDFYLKIIDLSKRFPHIDFLIKSKNYDWLNIPYFREIINQFNKIENIKILNDQKKFTTIVSVNYCDFAFGVWSSISDEIIALGKPMIIYEVLGSTYKFYDYGKIIAKNYDEVLKKFNLITEDFNKYNAYIDHDRNRIYYKSQPGKLHIHLNRILNEKINNE